LFENDLETFAYTYGEAGWIVETARNNNLEVGEKAELERSRLLERFFIPDLLPSVQYIHLSFSSAHPYGMLVGKINCLEFILKLENRPFRRTPSPTLACIDIYLPQISFFKSLSFNRCHGDKFRSYKHLPPPKPE